MKMVSIEANDPTIDCDCVLMEYALHDSDDDVSVAQIRLRIYI